jgi:hypothetical protein
VPGVRVPDRLILGFNPLLGMDHYLKERARDPQRVRSRSEVLAVLRAAVDAGATGFNMNAGPETAGLLRDLKEPSLPHPVGLYPMVPDERFFGTLLNQGTTSAVSAVLSGVSLGGKAKALLSGGWAYLTNNPFKALGAYLSVEIDRLAKLAKGFGDVRTLLVHELVTDAILGLGAKEAFARYVDHFQSEYGLPAGFVTRNFARFAEFCKGAGCDPRSVVVLTPVNAVGFQMAPSRESVEAKLTELNGDNVIAMSIFGGGLIPPAVALSYMERVKGVRSVAVGVSTIEHAATTFRSLGRIFVDT